MLKVRANPSGKPSTRNKTRQVKVRVGKMVLNLLLVCLKFSDMIAVMPLDVLGRTRATLTEPASSHLGRKVRVIL